MALRDVVQRVLNRKKSTMTQETLTPTKITGGTSTGGIVTGGSTDVVTPSTSAGDTTTYRRSSGRKWEKVETIPEVKIPSDVKIGTKQITNVKLPSTAIKLPTGIGTRVLPQSRVSNIIVPPKTTTQSYDDTGRSSLASSQSQVTYDTEYIQTQININKQVSAFAESERKKLQSSINNNQISLEEAQKILQKNVDEFQTNLVNKENEKLKSLAESLIGKEEEVKESFWKKITPKPSEKQVEKMEKSRESKAKKSAFRNASGNPAEQFIYDPLMFTGKKIGGTDIWGNLVEKIKVKHPEIGEGKLALTGLSATGKDPAVIDLKNTYTTLVNIGKGLFFAPAMATGTSAQLEQQEGFYEYFYKNGVRYRKNLITGKVEVAKPVFVVSSSSKTISPPTYEKGVLGNYYVRIGKGLYRVNPSGKLIKVNVDGNVIIPPLKTTATAVKTSTALKTSIIAKDITGTSGIGVVSASGSSAQIIGGNIKSSGLLTSSIGEIKFLPMDTSISVEKVKQLTVSPIETNIQLSNYSLASASTSMSSSSSSSKSSSKLSSSTLNVQPQIQPQVQPSIQIQPQPTIQTTIPSQSLLSSLKSSSLLKSRSNTYTKFDFDKLKMKKGFSEGTSKELFSAFALKFGKPFKIGDFAEKPKASKELGKFLIKTLSASGFITKGGKKLKAEETGLLDYFEFRKSKASPFLVVEKKSKRLRKGTTGKGIQAFRFR